MTCYMLADIELGGDS